MGFSILIPLGLVAVIVLLFIIFRIEDDSIDNFMGKVYKSAYDANEKDAMKKLKNKDPKMASDMEKVENLLAKNRERLSKMSPEEREKELQRTRDIVDSWD